MASSFQQIQAQQDLESLSLSPASSSLGSPHSGSESSNREPVVVIHNTFISLRADGKPAKSLKKSASDSTLHCPTPASSVVYEAPQHGGGSVSRPNSCVNSTCDADDLDKFIEPGQEEQHHEELQARLEVQALREQFWARLSLTEKDDPPEPINVEEPAELPRFLDRPVAQTSHWLRSPDSPVTQSTEMPASLLVMKFGGTSLASAQHLLRCASIVRKALPSRPVVVVSAMGKTTNALLQASKTALELGEVDISPIRKIHEQAMEELGVAVPESMAELLNELEKVLNGVALLKEISMQTRDRIVSFGERLSARAFAAAFNSSRTEPKEVDARPIDAWQIGMRTTSGAGSADSAFSSAEILGESRSAIEHHLGPLRQHYGHVPIVTGNIAQDAKNVITTLGRDGSDLTAAVIGAAVKASEVQMWKDVSGVQTTDPRVISAVKPAFLASLQRLLVAALVSRWCFPSTPAAGLRLLASAAAQAAVSSPPPAQQQEVVKISADDSVSLQQGHHCDDDLYPMDEEGQEHLDKVEVPAASPSTVPALEKFKFCHQKRLYRVTLMAIDNDSSSAADDRNSKAWLNLGCAGAGTVNGKYTTDHEYLIHAVSEDASNKGAWQRLGDKGGGEVKSQTFGKKACYTMANIKVMKAPPPPEQGLPGWRPRGSGEVERIRFWIWTCKLSPDVEPTWYEAKDRSVVPAFDILKGKFECLQTPREPDQNGHFVHSVYASRWKEFIFQFTKEYLKKSGDGSAGKSDYEKRILFVELHETETAWPCEYWVEE
mmetsp:Transcript_55095/g.128569  ORF Transcript_55095/g.128569 Transcript_55095/m.128569 type:complete len:775 (-) Transcript_55095:159-2483(-)